MRTEAMAMDGVGHKLIDALRRECTHGDADRYALRRMAALVDQVYEIEDAQPVIGRAYHRSLEVTERRKRLERLAVVE